jgi:hypothetical protein
MATKLFLRSTQANGIGATYFDMVSAAGSGAATAVVNTAASGTEIQWTQTAGGSVIQFVSGRAPAGGFTLTSTDISIWAQESNGQANSGGRYRVFRRSAAGVEVEIGGGPFNDGVEFGTSATEMLWAGNVTDQAFSEDDRILLKLYITNVGTMGAGRTCTLTYNAADASTGDSFFNIAETVAFKVESTTHATTGALTGPGTTVAGSSAHIARHTTTGALTGQLGSVAGSASSATVRPSSGVLVGQGSALAGSSAHKALHATSGTLAGQIGSVAGSAARTRAHATSGILAGLQAAIIGSAARAGSVPAVTHETSGALAGQLGSLSGTAIRIALPVTHTTSGTLSGPGATLVGVATLHVQHVFWHPKPLIGRRRSRSRRL